jgi:hypothetical protein
MRATCAILICLLAGYPAFGREHSDFVRSAGTLRAASTTSESEGNESGEDEMDDSDNQEMNNNDHGTETDDMDTGETTDTDDDNNGMKTDDDNDNETDDMDENMSSVKAAIRNAMQTSALQRSQKQLSTAGAALDAGLNAQETITQLLAPADSGRAAVASDAILASTRGGSAAGGNGALILTTSAAVTVSGSSSAEKLSIAAVPEPTAGLLLAMGALPWIWRRRR